MKNPNPKARKYFSEFARRYFAEGRATGYAEGRLELVSKLLTLRCETWLEGAREQLQSADTEQLDAVAERIVLAATLDEVFNAINVLNKPSTWRQAVTCLNVLLTSVQNADGEPEKYPLHLRSTSVVYVTHLRCNEGVMDISIR